MQRIKTALRLLSKLYIRTGVLAVVFIGIYYDAMGSGELTTSADAAWWAITITTCIGCCVFVAETLLATNVQEHIAAVVAVVACATGNMCGYTIVAHGHPAAMIGFVLVCATTGIAIKLVLGMFPVT